MTATLRKPTLKIGAYQVDAALRGRPQTMAEAGRIIVGEGLADHVDSNWGWQSFVSMIDQVKALPGVGYLGDLDDDAHVVGPSGGWPWTCYLLADVDTRETVQAACNLFRTIPVGTDGARLWKFAKVEARIGRALTIRDDG